MQILPFINYDNMICRVQQIMGSPVPVWIKNSGGGGHQHPASWVTPNKRFIRFIWLVGIEYGCPPIPCLKVSILYPHFSVPTA